MRYTFFACALAASLALTAPAFANAGGFQGPATTVETDTVAKVKSAKDDTRVVLTGHIIQSVAGTDDEYLFHDSTGDIVVDIDRELFMNLTVTPEDTVRLSGEVDKDMLKDATVDVKQLELVK